MGIMKINEDHHIVDFHEKPSDLTLLERLKTAPAILENLGLDGSKKQFLASMGIYLFRREALFNLLKDDPRDDFGKHLIPTKVKQGSIAVFPHDSYWEDIGTIDSFHKANIALTEKKPHFDCYNEEHPIYTHRYHLPGPKIYNTEITSSIICEGSVIEADEITNSLLGPRSIIKKGTIIRDTYVLGNDFYHSPARSSHHAAEHPFIDENCIIRKAIIDKNAYIGKNVQLINKGKLTHYDSNNIYIRDGIIVVPRGAIIPNGFIL
jgi:glucose-1-phosphate adenylyltransferase